MGKITLIILGIILVILGVLAIIPALNFAALWLAIVLLILGVLSIVFGAITKKQASYKSINTLKKDPGDNN